MPIVVKVPDKGNVEFPDDMSEEEMRKALEKLLAEEDKPVSGLPGYTLNDPRIALGEAVLSVVSSLGAEVFGGMGAAAAAPVAGTDKAVSSLEKVRSFAYQPKTEMGQKAVAGVGRVAEGITKAVRAPFAGIAGLFQLPKGVDAAASTTHRVMDEGIGKTAGGAVLEATGSPALAAATETVPVGLATLFGFKTPAKVAPKAPQVAKPVAKEAQSIASDIRKGDVAAVVADVAIDPQIIEAAKRLGIDLNPEHYSTSAQFREVARALKARAGTKLEAAERKALQQLSDHADQLVKDMGGSIDKADVSASIGNELKGVIRVMEDEAEALYTKVDEAIPRATRVEPQNVRDYLEQTITELGGDESLLTAAEKQLLALVRKKKTKAEGIEVEEVVNPTYAALDRVRRNVGDALHRRSGPFKDDEVGNLKRVYAALSEDQQAVASAMGAGDVYTLARSVVAKRKGIEDQAVQLFGKAMTESLVPRLRLAATSLAKGDIGKFQKLMDSLPEARRGEVAATIVGEIFGASARSGGLSGGFVSSYNALARNAAAKKVLFKYLPEGAEARFDDIGKVFTAIYKSNQKPLSNPSGSAAPIIAALENGGVLSKVYGVTRDAAVAEGLLTVAGVPPGVGTGSVIISMLRSKKTPPVQAADELLTSPAFEKAIGKALNGDITGANEIQSSAAFKKWLGTLDKQQAQRIANTGFIGWLVSEDEDSE